MCELSQDRGTPVGQALAACLPVRLTLRQQTKGKSQVTEPSGVQTWCRKPSCRPCRYVGACTTHTMACRGDSQPSMAFPPAIRGWETDTTHARGVTL